MVKIETTYRGGLRCDTTHTRSGNSFTTDAPVDNRGEGASFSPTDLVATGLGTCIATVMGIKAQDLGIDDQLEGMRVDVEKHMAANPRRISRIETTVTIPAQLDAPMRNKLERSARGCPVHHSLHPDVDVPITFHWGEERPA